MHTYYYDHLEFELPPHHRFPLEKYRLLRERLEQEQIVTLRPAPRATTEDLLLAHSAAYIQQIQQGTLPRQYERELGLPWSPELAVRVFHTVGATIAAARRSIQDGLAATTGGGTHHAQYDRPQGFCIFNDAVIAARTLQRERLIQRALVVDCDVHQGNGTALITADDPTIYTFSIHCQDNFPARKARSDLDIGLPVACGDDAYLAALEEGLERALNEAKPDWVIYLAGADPHKGDRLGKLSLTKTGLRRRDELVFRRLKKAKRPIAVTMAGGYGKNIDDTVDIYLQTLKTGVQFSKEW
ncbi:MAG: histone deacetylase [Ardenticatenaceae bacterium]|nr:histone deacetylase [Ardenticatenaceae bacterium]